MNIYYEPEDHGLKVVGVIEWSEPWYSFDFTAVWQDERGQYWIGSDSGCSCPTPFENINDVNQLDGPYLKNGTVARLKSLVEGRCQDDDYHYGYSKAEMLRKVSALSL